MTLLGDQAGDDRDRLRAAELAAGILANPLFIGICQRLDQALVDSWRREADPAARNDLWHQQRALAAIRGELQSAIDAAALAVARNDRRNQRRTAP